ncbi:MAG: hypothetical protein LBP76_07600 [Treponema sp.]|jgi:hypothetical protein|nr:hypothetical protein [Treponema sp.]
MRTPLLTTVALVLAAQGLPALELWQYPEMAEEHAVFLGGFGITLAFTEGFSLSTPEVSLDYLLPVGLPLSAGISTRPLDSVLNTALRIAYHINLNDEFTDLYLLYVFDFRFTRSEGKVQYALRAGLRRLLIQFICVSVESGFTDFTEFGFQIHFGISIKLN